MTMGNDHDPPSFDEVAQSFCPPGTDWDQFKAAMREAHQTGGYRPGQVAPDISAGTYLRPCPQCSTYHDGSGPCARPAFPADPFGADHVAAVALTEFLNDLVNAGMPLASAERILGTMLAVQGLMKQAAENGESP